MHILKPVDDNISPSDFVAYVARISNPANQMNKETYGKLIKYLIAHKHFSPFEQVYASVQINTTRDIGRQILRHRSFIFQEKSQRYQSVTGEFTLRETRTQDSKNRQNSLTSDDQDLDNWWKNNQKDVAKYIKVRYNEALEKGIAKEQARAILPEGLTKTTMIMTGNLRSWIFYCALRTTKGTQKEHRDVAFSVLKSLSTVYGDIFTEKFINDMRKEIEK